MMDQLSGAPQPMAATPETPQTGVDYHPIERLRRQYYDFLGAKDAEIKEAREARHYYHGSQWTAGELEKLKKRKQPAVTINKIGRKIDSIVGITERIRQDPKAFPRTPKQDQGADLATAIIRYALDNNDWNSKSSRIARFAAVDSIAGVEYNLKAGDHGDPDLELHIVYQDTFFYDPRSFDEGFTDCRYLGVAKWVDTEQAKELCPEKADEIDGLIEHGSDLTTAADADKEKIWINSNEKRVRLVDHWYIKGGEWLWCLYVANTKLMEGRSPFIDENKKTFPKYRCFSACVDHDGDRYAFIRNLKPLQDAINFRESKAMHVLNSSRLILEKGAVDDVEIARKEWARPDGVIEKNPGLEIERDDKTVDFKGQVEALQEAKAEFENFGPNPALLGQGLDDSSGRAINLLQQAAMSQLGPFLASFKNWKIRVYRDIWNILQRNWTSERWIRVTDDPVVQGLTINSLQTDPQTGLPVLVNALGQLDVDIIIDEGPDSVNIQADNMMVLQTLGPQFAQQFPDLAIELSPLAASVKKPMLDKLNAAKNQPPPPDPKVIAAKEMAQLEQQKAVAQFQIEQQRTAADMQAKREQAQAEIQVERERAENQMALERLKAANQIEIERIKAHAGIANDRLKAETQAELASETVN